LTNFGQLQSQGNHSLHIDKAATFENRGLVETAVQLALSGGGTLRNRGHFKSLLLQGQMGNLENFTTLEGAEIDLLIRDSIYNTGLIHGTDRTYLTSLTGQMENRGQIKGDHHYKLIAAGPILNQGIMAGDRGMIFSLKDTVLMGEPLPAPRSKPRICRRARQARLSDPPPFTCKRERT
jgi:hypothetical protein